MKHDGFLADVLRAPAVLEALLDAYDGAGSPLRGLPGDPAGRVVLTGMGSSCFAAATMAARLRTAGVDAVAELASTGSPSPPRVGTLAVGISASGSTPETVEALGRHRGRSLTVAVTNDPSSPLAAAADVVLPLHAGVEEGGVACLTFQATLAVLHLLAGRLLGSAPTVADLRPAVEAAVALRDSRQSWLPELCALLEGAASIHTIAPAERLSSALQSALMLREGPRLQAHGHETGDWLHVDVYLAKRPGYAALLFGGSRFDGKVMRCLTDRGSTAIAVGRRLDGAALTIPFPSAEDPLVQALVETGVAELAAAELWRRGVEAGDPALV